ncbi:hypothetical protein E4U10_001138 [Claviceps purpurea]|nr:hypothetical protein E4U10_001138 [Claviceps purpurea]
MSAPMIQPLTLCGSKSGDLHRAMNEALKHPKQAPYYQQPPEYIAGPRPRPLVNKWTTIGIAYSYTNSPTPTKSRPMATQPSSRNHELLEKLLQDSTVDPSHVAAMAIQKQSSSLTSAVRRPRQTPEKHRGPLSQDSSLRDRETERQRVLPHYKKKNLDAHMEMADSC